MSDTTVSILTPAGTGAIATVEVRGPRAWVAARQLFQPVNKRPLPETPELHRFWFGTLADGDEVVLTLRAIEPAPQIEVHCHGGRRVVKWVVDQFAACGVAAALPATPQAAEMLARAPTLRTAAILLDQLHGAFERAVSHTIERLEVGDDDRAQSLLETLAQYADLGRHLIEPWKVVFAGEPNVGKSSLINSLTGFQRSIVSEIAGTTRDVVSIQVAFDGWPLELIDTAGLRESSGLEAEGIEKARSILASADLVVWVMDMSRTNPEWPAENIKRITKICYAITKSDLPYGTGSGWVEILGNHYVSARTGSGIQELSGDIVSRLLVSIPPPGAALPFTPALADIIESANTALTEGRPQYALSFLRDALALSR